jgi:hypothetical protein
LIEKSSQLGFTAHPEALPVLPRRGKKRCICPLLLTITSTSAMFFDRLDCLECPSR